jgi:hypothetical protein
LDVLVVGVTWMPVLVVLGSACPHFIGADRQDALLSVGWDSGDGVSGWCVIIIVI